jgi:hypothetical protein
MKLRSDELAARKERLVAQIAAQRAELERQLLLWRKPMQAFDIARRAGRQLRAPATGLAAIAGVLLPLTRGRLLAKIFLVLRWTRFAARWWAFGRVLWRLGQGFAGRRRLGMATGVLQ